MMKKLISSVILISVALFLQAFSVVNESKYQATIKVKYESWWFESSFTVNPGELDFEYNDGSDSHTKARYIIEIVDTETGTQLIHKWEAHDHADTKFTIKSPGGTPELFVDDRPVV